MPAPKGNQFALGNKGTSKKWSTPEEFEKAIEDYFTECESNPIIQVDFRGKDADRVEIPIERPFTIEGLCLKLGCDRKTLLNYQKEVGYEDYFHIVTRAKRRITMQKLEGSIAGIYNATMTRFDLTNNTDYVDKKEVAQTTDDVDLSNLSPDDKLEWKRLKKKMRGE